MRQIKVGDFIKSPYWAAYYKVVGIEGGRFAIDALGVNPYWINMNVVREWLFRDPESKVIDWSRPVRLVKNPLIPCKVLDTDNSPTHPVVVSVDTGPSGRTTLLQVRKDGTYLPEGQPIFENIPETIPEMHTVVGRDNKGLVFLCTKGMTIEQAKERYGNCQFHEVHWPERTVG